MITVRQVKVYENEDILSKIAKKLKINDDENQRTLEYGDILFTGGNYIAFVYDLKILFLTRFL